MRKFTRLLALARGHDPVKALTIVVVAGLVFVLIVMVIFDFAQIALGLLEPFSFVALTADTIDGIFAYSLTSVVALTFLLLGCVSQACCCIITTKYYSHMEYKYERIEIQENAYRT